MDRGGGRETWGTILSMGAHRGGEPQVGAQWYMEESWRGRGTGVLTRQGPREVESWERGILGDFGDGDPKIQ